MTFVPASAHVRRVLSVALAAAAAAQQAKPDSQPTPAGDPPKAAAAFARFVNLVKVRWDELWLYIESQGLPDHEMMTGIRAWQQQVPLPQDYTGDNAWQVPRTPRLAATPQSAKTGFFRGAIAIAVNGIPIFNPIKNDGVTDTFLAGELDLFGGHSGRADDYHYHIAPVFLNGGDPSRAIAYALDGYPIYGYDEPDGSPCRPLDALNGHDDPRLGYHYHATKTYPYVNGGFRGEVHQEGGQVEPQPHEHPLREATTPLRGAVITAFARSEDGKTFTLTYELRGKKGTVEYTLQADGDVHFVFTKPDGERTEATYRGRDPQPDRRQRDQRPAPAPQHDPAPRQPWLAAHFAELDRDGDGAIAQQELDDECLRTYAGYDRDDDGKVTPRERDAAGAGHSAMGGFVKQHWQEVDADGDELVTALEIRATAQSMFDRADRDRDGRVTTDEARSRGGNERGEGQEGNGGEGRIGQGGGERRRGRGYAALDPGFQTDVPPHPYNAILVDPTPSSITVSVVSHRHGEAYVAFAPVGSPATTRTPTQHLHEGESVRFELQPLRTDTAYRWQLWTRAEGDKEFAASDDCSFHTPRQAGSPFTFTVQADSHLDGNVTPAIYGQMLANALADAPDFHVDLGDTFMTDKRRDFREAAPQYLAQRYWLGRLCHSAPLFLALGNHDGENGYAGRGPEDIAGWSFAQRTHLFPPPTIRSGKGAMYTGRTTWGDDGGACYYAFTWGDTLCCVLDPFWATTTRARGGGSEVDLTDESWRMSLGRAQYDWLARTLANSKAPFRFVFIHHLVGGRGRVARGGAEASPYFEWGGKNADGSDGFAVHRPGWPKPIHDLLVAGGVSAVFHGHDHLFVRGERDGIVYQCVPQPGNARGGTRSAAEYGYDSGTILGSPGHLRVAVGPTAATVAFVRASVADDRDGRRRRGDAERNGTVVHEYTLTPRRSR